MRAVSAAYEGAEGLRAYREASAETCEISAVGDPRRFRALCRVHHLGNVVLADVRSSSVRYLRLAPHLARAGYDHYQLTFNRSGDIQYSSGRHRAMVRPEDVVIVDSARETDAYVQAPHQGTAHVQVLFIPRTALAPLVRIANGAHLQVLSREQSLARALREQLSQVLQLIGLDEPMPIPAQAEARALIALLAAGLGAGGQPPSRQQSPHQSAADSLKRLIERRLDSPALSLELLCSHCGSSRATVYRLFEAEGGPMRYIHERRLQGAFRELMTGSASQRPIQDLALRHHFASESTFNRAFRRTFGLPPGEVRALAARSRAAALAGVACGGRQDGLALTWIRTLGAVSATFE